jgi:thiamine-phosphate pyrophosphorylase
VTPTRPPQAAPLCAAHLRLVYIVDGAAAADAGRLDAALTGGATALWLRAPRLDGATLYRVARDLRRRTRDHDAALIVGDRADVALAAEADAVQLGFRSPPLRRVRPWFPRAIGVSCHTARDLERAALGGADHVVLSPVFGVPEKGEPLGLPQFARWVGGCPLPVVGLGGITGAEAPHVLAAGAVGVAVIRALRDAADPAAAARALRDPALSPGE